jgi:hypothetical protein
MENPEKTGKSSHVEVKTEFYPASLHSKWGTMDCGCSSQHHTHVPQETKLVPFDDQSKRQRKL